MDEVDGKGRAGLSGKPGLLLGLSTMWHLWRCAVLSAPHTCGTQLAADGSQKSITDQVFNLLYSQCAPPNPRTRAPPGIALPRLHDQT